MEETAEHLQPQAPGGLGPPARDGRRTKNRPGEEHASDPDQGGQDMQGVDEGVGGHSAISAGGCDEARYHSRPVEPLKIYPAMARRRIRLPARRPRNSMLSAELKSQIQGAATRFLEARS